MGLLLLWCAAAIILPIIQGEGIVAVFFPFLIRRRPVRSQSQRRHAHDLWCRAEKQACMNAKMCCMIQCAGHHWVLSCGMHVARSI